VSKHVFFPGGYRSQVLEDFDALYRSTVVITHPWADSDIRAIATGLASIDEADHGLLLTPGDIDRARKARRLCLRALDRGLIGRASNLARCLIGVLDKAARFADHKDAQQSRRFNAKQSTRGKKGAAIKNAPKTELRKIYRQLSLLEDELEPLKPKPLWRMLFSELEAAGYKVSEKGGPAIKDEWYEVEGIGRIPYNTFRDAIQTLRRPG